MSVAVDEFGRPFIIIKEQSKQKRLKGITAIKSNILAAKSILNSIKTSFGPKGMDKILINQDGEVTITNDGSEIMKKMDIDHEIGKLLVELSVSQNEEVGDGTTGVVILAIALLVESLPLIEKGLHPLQISRSYDEACKLCVNHLKNISKTIKIQDLNINSDELLSVALTTLNSKMVRNHKNYLAKMAVKSVLSVADISRKDVNFDMIKVDGRVGSTIDNSLYIEGIILEKSLSHSQMKKEFVDPKIALLTCAFEPPKPKTKHFLNIESVSEYNDLYKKEQNYFIDMVTSCKNSGADIIFCQWGFDDEANHLLLKKGIPAVRWVGGSELELLSIATGAAIVGRFQDLTPDKLGTAGSIKEICIGNNSEKLLLIEKSPLKRVVSVFLRAGNKIALEEIKRSFKDSIQVVRNIIIDQNYVYGGGSTEISCSLYIKEQAKNLNNLKQYGMISFSKALEYIPTILAENNGLEPIKALNEAKDKQKKEEKHLFGIGEGKESTYNMNKEGVFETLIGKSQQIQLSTQLAKIILKTDDVIKKKEIDI